MEYVLQDICVQLHRVNKVNALLAFVMSIAFTDNLKQSMHSCGVQNWEQRPPRSSAVR